MRIRLTAAMLMLSFIGAGCATDRREQSVTAGLPPDVIYYGGTILTMDASNSTVGALAIRGDRILAVGPGDAIRLLAGKKTRLIDLGGRTVTPGFYAAHDHYPEIGMQAVSQVDLNSPPMGRVTGMSGLVDALAEQARRTPKGQWVLGQGYDDTLIQEMRHPTRHDLDRASTEHPILISHISGHLCVANSKALELAGVNKSTANPPGGVFRRDASTGELDGVLEESARAGVLRLIPALPREKVVAGFRWAATNYLAAGVTTVAIMGCDRAGVEELKLALDANIPQPRAAVYLVKRALGQSTPAEVNDLFSGIGGGRMTPVGVKMMQDGSIQGYTGYLTHPYHVPFKGDTAYRGYARRSREELTALVVEAHRQRQHIAIHGNGDAAIDDILAAFAEAQAKFPWPEARHRIEHCQTAREDQLDLMKMLGVTPSFFVEHVYYWGDRHRDRFLGPERAARISPLASAAKRGIRFTIHNDTPVTPVSPLHLIWTSVNRLTTSGQVLGSDQCITAQQALCAVTIDAAWQNHEEATKGSMEPGKLADFVILSENPLAIGGRKIKDIAVLETVIGGKTFYRQKNLSSIRQSPEEQIKK